MLSSNKTATVVKKTHSVKNNILSLPDRRILFLSRTYNGSVHDKKICDDQPLTFPKGINLWQDTGFVGYYPEGVNIRMPSKKPKGKELSKEQKQKNREISRLGYLSNTLYAELSVAELSKNVYVVTSLNSMI